MTDHSFENLLTDTEIDDQTLSKLVRLPMWTAQQAKQVLQAQARSGHSIVRFAARHRTSPSRLYTWRKRLESPATAAGVEALPFPFVPVCISVPPMSQTPAPLLPAGRCDPPCGLRVRMPSGATVRVYRDAPQSLVHCVLSALKEPPC